MFYFSSSQTYTTSGAMQLCVVHVLSSNPSIHQSIIYQLGGGGGGGIDYLVHFARASFIKLAARFMKRGIDY